MQICRVTRHDVQIDHIRNSSPDRTSIRKTQLYLVRKPLGTLSCGLAKTPSPSLSHEGERNHSDLLPNTNRYSSVQTPNAKRQTPNTYRYSSVLTSRQTPNTERL